VFDVSRHAYIMGVVNITPDSFSDGGQYISPHDAISHVFELVDAGADIIDLGAESSRPGAPEVSGEQELERLVPVLEGIVGKITIPISIDTTKASVARECLRLGAHIINDISGLQRDQELAAVISDYGAGCVMMHMRGSSETMQTLTHYDQLINDIVSELRQSIAIADAAGISHEALIIDPGIGFAKTVEQNYDLLRELKRFKELQLPILIGPSRKSFIGSVLRKPEHERIWGTAAAVAIGVHNGADFVRVHDVAAMHDVVRIAEQVRLQDR